LVHLHAAIQTQCAWTVHRQYQKVQHSAVLTRCIHTDKTRRKYSKKYDIYRNTVKTFIMWPPHDLLCPTVVCIAWMHSCWSLLTSCCH